MGMGLETEHPWGAFSVGSWSLDQKERRGWPCPASELFLSDAQDSRELLCILQGE